MLQNHEGQRVPDVTFRTRQGTEWVNRTSKEIFAGRTVIVFSLPGAFTPTCSSTHVPRYNQFAPAFRAQGVDEIICMAVNDAFVMNEWQQNQLAWDLTFLPDGNGEFADRMGLLVGKEDLGFGRRSWRYSMLVRDGRIEKMFIEPEEPGDPFKVSDADTMLAYLAPGVPKPLDVTVLTRTSCPHCLRAKTRLAEAGIGFEELTLNKQFSDRTLRAIAGSTAVPQIFVDGVHIGGADDLEKWLAGRKAA